MSLTPFRAATAVVGAALLALAAGPAAPAQEAAGGQECTLTLQPTDSTRSVSREVGADAYVTNIWNGMTWICDPATMTADSAVQYDRRDEVVMIGSVHYRDTIRDLRSRRLTYFQRDDRVLAEDSVRLRQLETGAVLRGPRVEFYNAVTGDGPQRTVATRRPTMRIPSAGDTAGDPFRVVADTAVFVGEEAAEAVGDVVIRRGSLTARGGYARFRIRGGSGFLTRSPSVTGEGYTLTGDTIDVRFAGSELRAVRARGDGHLETEDVEVRGPTVDVRIVEGRADELWAYGEGGARAFSATQEIRGDSLHFEVGGGRLNEITAVGEAVALEIRPGETPATDSAARATGEEGARPELDRSWITGDTVRALFAAASDSAAVDSVVPAADSADRPAADVSTERDSAPAVAAAADTTPPARDTAAGTRLEELLAIGDARSFYRIRRDSAETAGPGGPATPPGAAQEASGRSDERRMARNYVIGDRITIQFREGEPLAVRGTRAIGLFLEPVEGGGSTTAPDSAAPSDSVTARDTAAEAGRNPGLPPRDSVVSDTTAALREGRSNGRAGTLLPVSGISRPGGMIYE